LRAAVLDFEVPRRRIIPEIFAEILFVPVPKMKVSYLLDILVGGVGYIDQLPVGEVIKKVPIGLPPVLGRWLWWHGDSVGWWLCVVVRGGAWWDQWAWKKLQNSNAGAKREKSASRRDALFGSSWFGPLIFTDSYIEAVHLGKMHFLVHLAKMHFVVEMHPTFVT
jgi:hypothetical protein